MVNRKVLLTSFAIFDLAVMGSCFLASFAAVMLPTDKLAFGDLLALRIKVQNFIIFLGFLFAWYLIFAAFGLYHSKRLSSRLGEIGDIGKAIVLGTLVVWLSSLVLGISFVTSKFVVVFFLCVTSLTITSRLVLRSLLIRARIYGRNLRSLVLVGTNSRSVQLADKISKMPGLGYTLLGFVDNGFSVPDGFYEKGHRIIADFRGFRHFLRKTAIDEVIVCLPIPPFYKQVAHVVSACQQQGVTVRLSAEMLAFNHGRLSADHVEGTPILTIHSTPMEGLSSIVKRITDLLLSAIIVVLTSPLLLITALLIKVWSHGPVLFIQQRVGHNKRIFRFYKFRTMVAGAETKQAELEHLNEVSGPVFKIKNDPRVTPLGRFLRKTSIDELPQLLNVFKGDMSLVGPRPLPVRDYEGFSEDWHRRRFSVRPGITCLWQVCGRNNIEFNKWMELDLEYIDNWSIGLDFKILAMTLPAVLQSRGAS